MLLLILFVVVASSQDLRRKNERVIFDFRTEKNKILAPCIGENSRYLAYR